MTTQQVYALVGLTAIVALLVGVLTFAALKFMAAARDTKGRLRGSGAETAFLTAALHEAVTKLKAQEQAMSARAEASERLSEEIVASLTAGLLVVDDAGDVQILNPAGRRLLNIGDEAALGGFRALLAPAGPLVEAVEECLATGRPIVRRSVRVPAGHRVSHFGVTVSPLRGADPATGPRGAICLFSDLTAVMELEEQLRLKDTLARLGELTAGIAHEFRNGLATIHGYSRLMTPQELPEAYRPYMAGIRDETEALGRVVTNFLNFARPDRVVFSRVDLGPLMARAIEEMGPEVPEGEVTMRGTFAQIDGDDVLLRQMLMNLVRNSLDACRDAGRTPAIVVEGWVDPAERVCGVAVHDNGPGIAADVRDRIFTPFFTTKAKGTGLGLSIVQKIAVTHNGRVAAAGSPLLGGARVEVTFPLPDGV